MKRTDLTRILAILIGAFIVLALADGAFAQGRGRGNSGNSGNSSGKGNSQNADKKKESDDTLWNGNDDDRKGKGNSNRGNSDDRSNGSQRFKGLAKSTGMSQEYLESRYAVERKLNPDLTYGQFVAAHMISKNNKGISSEDILGGLRNGKSIGQVLQDRKWDRKKIDKERKRIRDKHKDDKDYDDRDVDWLF